MPAIFSARAARRRGRHPRRRRDREQGTASQGGCPGNPLLKLRQWWELIIQLPIFSSCCGGGRGRNGEDGEDAVSDSDSEVADDGSVDSSSVPGTEDRSLGAGEGQRDELAANAAHAVDAANERSTSPKRAAFKLNPAAPEWRPASLAPMASMEVSVFQAPKPSYQTAAMGHHPHQGVSNGRGYQNGQLRPGSDVAAFASLGADAWGSTSTGATAVAAAPVRPHAGPQQPQGAPQQAGPYHASKQPTLAQEQEAMSSAGVGMAEGGGNPLRGIESPGLTAATGIATGAAEQAGGNPFDMFLQGT